MYYLLLIAIKYKQEESALLLLQLMLQQSLLTEEQRENIARNLAMKGLLKLLKLLVQQDPNVLHRAKSGSLSPLIVAVLSNQVAVVDYIIAERFDTFCTPLHQAAFYNKIKMPIALDQLTAVDARGNNSLIYAASAGHLAAVMLLQKLLSDPRIQPIPIGLNEFEQFVTASEFDDLPIANLNIDNGSSIELEQMLPEMGSSVYIQCSANQHLEFLSKILPSSLTDKDVESIMTVILLNDASASNTLKILLTAINRMENKKDTQKQFFLSAIKLKRIDLAELILLDMQLQPAEIEEEIINAITFSISLRAFEKRGDTPEEFFKKDSIPPLTKLYSKYYTGNIEKLYKLLIFCINTADAETLLSVLRNIPANIVLSAINRKVETQDASEPLLHHSTALNQEEHALILLTKGADVSIKNSEGKTAEQCAFENPMRGIGPLFSQRKTLVPLYKRLHVYYDAVDKLDSGDKDTFLHLTDAIANLQSGIKDARAKRLLSIPNYADRCLNYLWIKTKELCDKKVANEKLQQIVLAANRLTLDPDIGISAYHFCALMHLNFLLGNYKLAQSAIDIFKKVKFANELFPEPLFLTDISRILISQVMLVFFEHIKRKVPQEISDLLKVSWSDGCTAATLTDVMLLIPPDVEFSKQNIEAIIKDLSLLKFKECIPKDRNRKEDLEFLDEVFAYIKLFNSWILLLENKLLGELPKTPKEFKTIKVAKETLETLGKYFQLKQLVSTLLNDAVSPLLVAARSQGIKVEFDSHKSEFERINQFSSTIMEKKFEEDLAPKVVKQKKKKVKIVKKPDVASVVVEEPKPELKAEPAKKVKVKREPQDKFAKFPEKIIEFMKKFPQYSILLVGGAVRDLLLNREPNDFDFVVFLSPEELKKLFPSVQELGAGKHRTYRLDVDGIQVDILCLDPNVNLEIFEEVMHALKQDSLKRDFTMNALYYCLYRKLLDPTGKGKKHLLRDKLIEDVNPEVSKDVFATDPIRLLRAFYYKLAFEGFSISDFLEGQLKENQQEAIKSRMYSSVLKIKNYFLGMVDELDVGVIKELFEHYKQLDVFEAFSALVGKKPPSPRLFDASSSAKKAEEASTAVTPENIQPPQ